MKIITFTGCLILMSAIAIGAAGCKRSGPNSGDQLSNHNAKPVSAPALAKAPSAFRTEAKTATGEDIYRLETGGVKFVLPKTWTAVPDETQMTLASEDNVLRIMISVSENEDYESVINNLPEELGKVVQNARPDAVASRTKLNGLDALTQHGVGDLDDAQVSWKLDVIKAKKPIIILTYATTEIDEPHNIQYTAFMDSILPLG